MKMLKNQGTTLRQIVEVVRDKMDIADAVRRLEGRLPEEVASLVRLTAQGAGKKVKANTSHAEVQAELANTNLSMKRSKVQKWPVVRKTITSGNASVAVAGTNSSGKEVKAVSKV